MAQVIQPLELALLEVDFFQGSTTLFLQHAEALYGRIGTVFHAFEWLFVRLAPIVLLAALVGIFMTRKKV